MVTYCTNIHPGETWDEVFGNLRTHLPAVKSALAPGRTFPVGLRLSARAARDLDRDAAARFRDWCDEHGYRVSTLNGFPYGTFHGVPIKEQVYLPDWRHRERLEYTRRLADLLASWLPAGERGSISTVPVGFRSALVAADLTAAMDNLAAALEHLDRIAQRTGRQILLSLEPEPGCWLETTAEVVTFFGRLSLPEALRRHLAVCFDCCHQSLQYETPADSLAALARAGIPVGHVQVSSALRLAGPDLGPLAPFCEPWYLHQTVGRRGDGSLVRFADLPEALAADPTGVEEWRVHFHVPIFVARLAQCESTRSFLEEILPLFPAGTPMEVETYTWSVLPEDLRIGTVTESIVREVRWAESRLRSGAEVVGGAGCS